MSEAKKPPQLKTIYKLLKNTINFTSNPFRQDIFIRTTGKSIYILQFFTKHCTITTKDNNKYIHRKNTYKQAE